MAQGEPRTATGVYFGVLCVVVLMGVLVALGLWLGSGSSLEEDLTPSPPPDAAAVPEPAPSSPAGADQAVFGGSFCLWVSGQPDADPDAVADEVRLAAGAGFNRCIVTVPLPWEGEDPAAALGAVRGICEANPRARVMVHVLLDPPASWLDSHLKSIAEAREDGARHVSVACPVWLDAACGALDRLHEAITEAGLEEHLTGWILGALEEGQWRLTGPHDRSEANLVAFRAWLQGQYSGDEGLREAWGDSDLSIEEAVPPNVEAADGPEVFVSLPEGRALVDFRRYTAQSVARAIERVTRHVKEAQGTDSLVYVPYGYTFEFADSSGYHGALGTLLLGPVDGFVSPVSHRERGLGSTAGFWGPVNSACYHGKQWLLVDDTPTGVRRDAVSGQVERNGGLRIEDVYGAQRRNFAPVLAHGLALAWADPKGEGRLLHEEMWRRFGIMGRAYEETWRDCIRIDGTLDRSAGAEAGQVSLMVVVDEGSRFYERDPRALSERFYANVRDCALRAGVPTAFCLLSDLLDESAPPASVCLIVNAFHLTTQDRVRLHEVLRSRHSAALWLYAPGILTSSRRRLTTWRKRRSCR